ncbi:MAG: flagellin [Gemmatimonadetes bacterium]|jgi:flagellin|nr:flagellin [Gemmatimonadota bacterium]MBT5060486.1 flagellin [Gemmatimonadota bacterium]MBT5142543.1 flagellin [Gemmatimonadota bacterium]MBT5587176.1 flagellin [Gemmatimonadota bacterium]MBT5961160.1 flagellin [Gemmatimonadota bacterium]
MFAARINSNAAFQRASHAHGRSDRELQFSRTRLGSGMRINSARDDVGRLSISEGMRAEIGGLTEGTRNTEKAIDLLRTAEGAMGEINSILIRMRELATQATSDTLNDTNRDAVHSEFNQLKDYIDRIAKLASYNDQNLLSGFGNDLNDLTSTAIDALADNGIRRVKLSSVEAGTYTFTDSPADNSVTLSNGTISQTVEFGSIMDGDHVADGTTVVANFDQLGIEVVLAGQGVAKSQGSYTDGDLDGQTLVVEEGVGGSFQLGGDADIADRLDYDIKDMTVGGKVLGIEQLSVGSRDSSRHALAQIDGAINRMSKERGEVGAVLNRLQHTLNFTEGSIENVTASEGTVRDTDYSVESGLLAKGQILQDLSRSAMIQSQVPIDTVMSLLTG